MKLKFFIDSKGKKQYTLKNEVGKKATLDAHYKFIKIKSTSNAS
ncbi:MAG TPA: hypothetical protein VHA12_00495 [Candidatus Nanoarchaeia archaeon]|nr:hypothetical protein [Candidatus Nanoarchaeia archaeon]